MDAKPPSSAAPGAGPSITDADRERTRLIRHGNECGHGMWYRIDCDDCISAIIASAREAGEAKGRAEEREACVKIAVYYKTFKVNEPALSIEQAIRARGEAAK